MVTSRRSLLCSLAVVGLSTLSACGGASFEINVPKSGWPPGVSSGPIDVYGTLEESGAVTLVGVHFDASTADVSVNGQAATVVDLRAGQVVHVVGTVHTNRVTGSASSVGAEAALVGPVWSVSAGDARFVALGQAVRTDANTEWDPRLPGRLPSDLPLNVRVEVHGWRDAEGEILATRVGWDDVGGEAQVVGRLAKVHLAAAQVTIGGLTVDCGAATVVDVEGGLLVEGRPVVVRGIVAGGTLLAREIRSVPLQLVQVHHLLP